MKQPATTVTVGPVTDAGFVRLVDVALADATRRSGSWLACRPGCAPCCHGVFGISMLDAARLRSGLQTLQQIDPSRAERVQSRVFKACLDFAEDYPGDPVTGTLFEDELSQERFAEFANEAACPVLDPLTQQCDLYAARPITCRAFGPPVHTEDGIGMCELCFRGATEEDVHAGLLHLPDPAVEALLTEPLGPQRTIIAFALRQPVAPSRTSEVHVR